LGRKLDNIRTRWHRAQACLETEQVSIKTGLKSKSEPVPFHSRAHTEITALFDLIEDMPKYYVEPELVDILNSREDLINSVKAMHTCGIARLPYPAMLVELEGSAVQGQAQVRNFIVLSERPETVERLPTEQMFHPFRANLFRLVEYHGQTGLLFAAATYWLAFDPNADAGEGKTGFGIHYMTAPAPYVEPGPVARKWIEDTGPRDLEVCDNALFAMVLLLNTKGVHKEVVFPQRLNVSRKRSGKREIPSHTVIRIGHVYSSDGKRKDVPGWKQRFHIRAGYAATRWIGKRDGTQTAKMVYVEPYVVNYDPSKPGQGPLPRHVHVRL
jgi:hypothetical protein